MLRLLGPKSLIIGYLDPLGKAASHPSRCITYPQTHRNMNACSRSTKPGSRHLRGRKRRGRAYPQRSVEFFLSFSAACSVHDGSFQVVFVEGRRLQDLGVGLRRHSLELRTKGRELRTPMFLDAELSQPGWARYGERCSHFPPF